LLEPAQDGATALVELRIGRRGGGVGPAGEGQQEERDQAGGYFRDHGPDNARPVATCKRRMGAGAGTNGRATHGVD
jgi:hypothetical protein